MDACHLYKNELDDVTTPCIIDRIYFIEVNGELHLDFTQLQVHSPLSLILRGVANFGIKSSSKLVFGITLNIAQK